MKKLIEFLFLGVLFIVFTLFYLKYDAVNYYYGKGSVFCNDKLPYALEPKFYNDYPQRFYLLDADGFELVGVGFRYEKTDFTIKGFSAYGYNDTSIMVKCIDSLKNTKYLVSYKTGYKSKKGTEDISFKSINDNVFEQSKHNYKWVELDEIKASKTEKFMWVFILGCILSFVLIIFKLFRLSKEKATH